MRQPWHFHERRFVRENYRKMPTREIAARLGRTVGSIKREAARLGLSGANHRPWKWSDAKKRRFLELYRSNPALAAERFGLTRMSANAYASRFFGAPIRRPWSSDEDSILRALWPQHSDEELAARLKGRSMGAARSRAYKLGLRRPAIHCWTSWRFHHTGR